MGFRAFWLCLGSVVWPAGQQLDRHESGPFLQRHRKEVQKATRRVVLPRMPDRGRNSPASLDAEIRHRRDRGPASGSVWVNQDRLVPWVLGAAI